MKRRAEVEADQGTMLADRLDRVIYADLIATALLSVLAFGTVEPWSIAVFEINALALGFLLALRYVFAYCEDRGRMRIAAPLIALILFGLIQIAPLGIGPASPALAALGLREATGGALSYDVFASRLAIVKLLALAIYFLAGLHSLGNPGRRKATFALLTGFGFFVSIFAIVHRLTNNGKMYWVRPVSESIAPYGPYGNYNHFAGLIEMIFPLPLACALFGKIRPEQRILWLFSAVIMATALIFSLSRGGVLSMGVELFLLLTATALGAGKSEDESGVALGLHPLLSLKAASGLSGLLLTLFAAIAIALWIGSEALVDRFHLTAQGRNEFSVVTRLEYWSAGWKMFLDHPAAGVGLGAFPAVYPAYGASTARYERLEQTHNDYLQLLTDAGLIGAVIAVWFLFEILRVARRQFRGLKLQRPRERAMILGAYTAAAGLLVHSWTDFNLQIAANALIFLLMIALATAETIHDENSIARFSRAAPNHP